MALLRDKTSVIPADAIRLSPSEALEYQWNQLEEYDGPYLFSIKFGPGILGAIGAATGVYINNYYRTRLRLGKLGFVTSYIPIVLLPAMMSTMFHRTVIQPNILLQNVECPLCLQVQAAALQSALGTVYPALLAPLASYMFAVRHFTYKLPSITDNPIALFMAFKKMTKPISMTLTIALAINGFSAAILTYREQLSFYKFQMKLIEDELKLENDSENLNE